MTEEVGRRSVVIIKIVLQARLIEVSGKDKLLIVLRGKDLAVVIQKSILTQALYLRHRIQRFLPPAGVESRA